MTFENKKFLDKSGITHLWGKIENQFINSEELNVVVEAIDEVKADKTDIVQADWNQNDETALDYVKNRTHWAEHKTLFTLTLDENIQVGNQYSDIEAQGYSYKLVNMAAWEFTKNIGAINLEELIGGELKFRRKKYDAELGQYTEIESHTLQITSDFISNDTLLVQPDGFGRILQLTSSGDLTLYCDAGTATFLPWNYPTSLEILNVKQIDPMFISIPNDNILNGSEKGSIRTVGANTEIGAWAFAEGYQTTASGINSHAEGGNTKASGYASHTEGYGTEASDNYAHAEGYYAQASGWISHAEGNETIASGDYGSHAEGYKTKATGQSSHAEGDQTTASGYRSHAEGYYSVASGPHSHAENYRSKAIGDSSHAEGYETEASGNKSHAEGEFTVASGNWSHTEGYRTTASGDYSHAEGAYTTASGQASHVEGDETTASGDRSHAEGYYTKASGEYQHVQGKFNIEDTENKYAHIVGNGNYDALSNAHTLDWDGNAWFQGTIKVGGTSQEDENAVEVATKTDLDSYEFITVADIDEICNAVTEGSLESTDVDYLMAQLNFGVSTDELSPEEIEKLMNKLQ